MNTVRRILNHRVTWWFALLIVLIIGASLYLKGYDLGLPLHESKDERRNILEVFILRDLRDVELWKPGYPPGILYVNYLAQYITEATSGLPATVERCLTIINVRRAGVFFNMINALLIGLIVQRMSNKIMGIVAMLGWLFSVEVIMQTQFGFPQTYELFSYLLAMYLALLAIDIPSTISKSNRQQALYAILSVIAGLLAVIFKYSAFPVLGLGVGVSLWHLRHERVFWLKVLGIQFGLIVLCAVWLIFGYDALRLIQSDHVETTIVVSGTGLDYLTDWSIWAKRYRMLARQAGLGTGVYARFVVVGGALYLYQTRRILRLVYGVTLALVFLHVMSLVMFLAQGNNGLRQNLTITGYSTVLIALGIWGIAHLIFDKISRVVGLMVGVALVLFWLKPNIENTIDYVIWRDLPVSQGEFVEWAGMTLPPQDGLVVRDIRPFTNEWSCYAGDKPPRLLEVSIRDVQDLIDLRNDNYAFVQMDETQRQKLESNQFGQAALNQMTLIAHIPPLADSANWRTWRRGFPDHQQHVYSIYPIAETTNLQFGDSIELVGYTIHTEQAGDTLPFRLYWRVIAPITADYELQFALIDDSTVLVEGSASPNGNNNRPTSTWNRQGELMLIGRVDIDLPSDFQVGEYVLELSLVDIETGESLPTENGNSLSIPITFE